MANVSFCACWTSRKMQNLLRKVCAAAVIADHLMKRIDLPLNIMLLMAPISTGSQLFGLFAMTLMLVFYALEDRSPWYVLAFAGACALASVYGFLQGSLARSEFW